jgi:hypothetical protein
MHPQFFECDPTLKKKWCQTKPLRFRRILLNSLDIGYRDATNPNVWGLTSLGLNLKLDLDLIWVRV